MSHSSVILRIVSKLRRLAWGIAAVFGVAAVVSITLVGAGNEAVVEVTLPFTIIAALAAALGAFITWTGNRASAAHQRQLDDQQSRMANDLRRLAELTESSLEEARAQRPEPLIHFLVGPRKEPTDQAVWQRKRLDRRIDIERVVDRERELALSSLVPPKPAAASPPSGTPSAVLETFAKLSHGAVFGGMRPITESERNAFVERVDEYADVLREWLQECEDWWSDLGVLFGAYVVFGNHGRVPARDVRAELTFPDGFEAVEEPPDPPGRPPGPPKFKRQTFADIAAGLSSQRLLMPDLGTRFNMTPIPVPANVSGPHYRRGSSAVEFELNKLLHGVPEESDEPVVFRVENDGTYRIPWKIHAENLAAPAQGELVIDITSAVVEGPPITTLEEVLSLIETVMRSGNDAEGTDDGGSDDR